MFEIIGGAEEGRTPDLRIAKVSKEACGFWQIVRLITFIFGLQPPKSVPDFGLYHSLSKTSGTNRAQSAEGLLYIVMRA